jgi:hypothetical protein
VTDDARPAPSKCSARRWADLAVMGVTNRAPIIDLVRCAVGGAVPDRVIGHLTLRRELMTGRIWVGDAVMHLAFLFDVLLEVLDAALDALCRGRRRQTRPRPAVHRP